MSKSNSIPKGIVSNVGGYLVSVLIAFVIAPITIHTLGNTRYGAWSLVSELIGYYGLLDLGIRGAVTYYVARFAAHDEVDEIKEILSSAFWVLSACGLVAFVVGVGIALGFPYFFDVPKSNLLEVQFSLVIMSALIACSLPMNAFSGALVGKQRFDISSAVEVANRIVTAVLVYIVLKMGGGLVALAIVQAVGRSISWAFTLAANRHVLGGVFVNLRWFRADRVRALAGYGFRNSVGQVALLIIYRVDLTVVGLFAGVDKVTFYSIASTLVSYLASLCTNITFVFTPRFAHLNSHGNTKQLNELYLFGMRVTGMVVTSIVAGLLVFGKDFIRLWLGDTYVSGSWTIRSDTIMAILVFANLPQLLLNIARQRLYAMARVRFLMWLNIGEAVANLSLSILLARRYGPAGVALGTFIPLMVSQLMIMPFYSSRAFGIPLRDHLQKGLATPLLTGLLATGIDMLCIRILPPTTWVLFSTDVCIAGTLAGVVCFGLGFTRNERRVQLARFNWRPDAKHA